MVIGMRRRMNHRESLVCLMVMGLTLSLIMKDGKNNNGMMITAFMTPTYIRKSHVPTSYFPTRNIIIGSSIYSTKTPKDEKSRKVNIQKKTTKEPNNNKNNNNNDNSNPIQAETSKQKKQTNEKEETVKKVVEISSHTKIRRLKDRMWVREALEDITAAEFACTLDSLAVNDESSSSSSNSNSSNKKKKVKRAVDFENILSKLDRRVEEMCVQSTYGDDFTTGTACYPLDHNTLSTDIEPDDDQQCWVLKSGKGMGSLVYSDDQRDALLL